VCFVIPFFFVIGERIHLVPAMTAIIGAAITLVVGQANVQEILRVVEWATLSFFIALFMRVGALQEVGLMGFVGSGVHHQS
jgi:Na+/H+ antiporter NhaD/arsenite permease-like protein